MKKDILLANLTKNDSSSGSATEVSVTVNGKEYAIAGVETSPDGSRLTIKAETSDVGQGNVTITEMPKLSFVCYVCDCKFNATKDDINVQRLEIGYDLQFVELRCKCPVCGCWASKSDGQVGMLQ